jgi:hypothetical protein
MEFSGIGTNSKVALEKIYLGAFQLAQFKFEIWVGMEINN